MSDLKTHQPTASAAARLSLDDRICRVSTKLRALTFLFSEVSIETAIDTETMAGIGLLLDDIRGELEPIRHAPNEILDWKPRTEATAGGVR